MCLDYRKSKEFVEQLNDCYVFDKVLPHGITGHDQKVVLGRYL